MKLLTVLFATLLLQGCFIAVIPVSAISDVVTGSSGGNCVGAKTKVGDMIKLADGTTLQVKTLSGTSGRCTDAVYPIRAMLVPV